MARAQPGRLSRRSRTHQSAAPSDQPISLWQNRDFTAFWIGETVSQVGTQITLVALPLAAVLTLDAGSGQLGALQSAQYLPFLAFTLLFGVWADRRRRRPLMVASNAIRGVLIASVPTLATLGLLTLPLLAAVAFAAGTCAALFDVCRLSYVPGLVDRSRLVEAMGKVSTSRSATEVAGRGMGGLLVQLITAPFALVFDALSYLVSVVSLLTIRHQEPDPVPGAAARRHLGRELAEGLRFAFGEPHIRATAFAAGVGNFFSLITETVFLLYAVRELHLSAALIGLVLTSVGMGGLLGAAFANTISRRFPFGRVYLTARIAGGFGALLLPLATGPKVMVVAMCFASFFVVQAALANTNVLGISLSQALTPDDIRARMNASVRTLAFGSLCLGGLAAGFFSSVLGLHATLWLAAIGYTATLIPVLASPLPHVRSVPAMPGAG